jgi:hypothetical protein
VLRHVPSYAPGNAVLPPEGYLPNGAISGSTLNFVRSIAAHCEVVDGKWGMFMSTLGRLISVGRRYRPSAYVWLHLAAGLVVSLMPLCMLVSRGIDFKVIPKPRSTRFQLASFQFAIHLRQSICN